MSGLLVLQRITAILEGSALHNFNDLRVDSLSVYLRIVIDKGKGGQSPFSFFVYNHLVSESAAYNDFEKWTALIEAVQAEKLSKAISALLKGKIEPILFKGLAIARLYPKNARREPSSDIDLAVAPGSLAQAKEILENTGVFIDLKEGLEELSGVSWTELKSRCEEITVSGTKVLVPCVEDHLRIVITHWLLDGGERRERLKDVRYLIESKRDMDWDLVLHGGNLARRSWYRAVIAAARDFAGLSKEFLPQSMADYCPPQWFYSALEKQWRQKPVQRTKLLAAWRNPMQFYRLLRRQLPPNPISATIFLEREINDDRRLPIQLETLYRRTLRELGWKPKNKLQLP